MSEGLKLIAACINENKPGILLKLDGQVLIDGPEVEAHRYAIRHYREFGSLPQAATIRENTGVNIGNARETAEYYEANCYNRFANAQAKEVFPNLRSALEETTSEAIERAAQAAYDMLQALRAGRPVNRVYNAQQLGQRVVNRLRASALATRELTGLTSGWPEFDTITDGYQNADLVFWVARPGMGKTWFLLWQVWSAIMAGHRILVGTTEMNEEQIARRLAAIATGINPQILKSGRVSTYDQRRITEMFEELSRAMLIHVISLGFNSQVSEIDAACEDMRPDGIYLDGIYLLKPSVKGNMSRTEKVAYVADELKMIALSRNLPVVCTTQFNRMAGKGGKDGSLETVGMSDALVQNGSLVIRLGPGNTIEPARSREVFFMKGREGEEGTLNFHFRFAPLNFSAIPEDEVLGDNNEGLGE